MCIHMYIPALKCRASNGKKYRPSVPNSMHLLHSMNCYSTNLFNSFIFTKVVYYVLITLTEYINQWGREIIAPCYGCASHFLCSISPPSSSFSPYPYKLSPHPFLGSTFPPDRPIDLCRLVCRGHLRCGFCLATASFAMSSSVVALSDITPAVASSTGRGPVVLSSVALSAVDLVCCSVTCLVRRGPRLSWASFTIAVPLSGTILTAVGLRCGASSPFVFQMKFNFEIFAFYVFLSSCHPVRTYFTLATLLIQIHVVLIEGSLNVFAKPKVSIWFLWSSGMSPSNKSMVFFDLIQRPRLFLSKN